MTDAVIQESIKHLGFIRTLEELKDIQRTVAKFHSHGTMRTITEGVMEETSYGKVEASVYTKEAGLMLVRGWRTSPSHADLQTSSTSCEKSVPSTGALTADQILAALLDSEDAVQPDLVCEVEITAFDANQRNTLLPLLLKYILKNRQSTDRKELIAVGSAIRKYIAIMPMDEMGELSELLAPANHEPLPLELELEIAKMIYRNFEVDPPTKSDPFPELASRLWEMVTAYTNPRILLRDKHSSVASLAIEALVAMRSSHATVAWKTAIDSPYSWFGEMVSDDLLQLEQIWEDHNHEAFEWLSQIKNEVIATEPALAMHP